MLTTPTRSVFAQDIVPGDNIRLPDDPTVVVDEVRNTADGVTIYGRVPGTERKSRRTFPFERGAVVQVLPTADELDTLCTILADAIAMALAPDTAEQMILGGQVNVTYGGQVGFSTLEGPVWTAQMHGYLPLPPDEVDGPDGEPVAPGDDGSVRLSEAAMAAADEDKG